MELFIRAFWRRIEPYKNQYGKNLPDILPDEFSSAAFVATHFYEEKIKEQKDCEVGNAHRRTLHSIWEIFDAGAAPPDCGNGRD